MIGMKSAQAMAGVLGPAPACVWTAELKEYNKASGAAATSQCGLKQKVLHIYRTGNGFVP
jgi:hypothetical protein